MISDFRFVPFRILLSNTTAYIEFYPNGFRSKKKYEPNFIGNYSLIDSSIKKSSIPF